jgi:hypothetical protein
VKPAAYAERVAWRIESGPLEPGPPGKDAVGVGWGWLIARDQVERLVTVWVSGALTTTPELRSDEVNRAIETKGRSEVEGSLNEEDPPRIIQWSSSGRNAARW